VTQRLVRNPILRKELFQLHFTPSFPEVPDNDVDLNGCE